jgi:hypothetical protein
MSSRGVRGWITEHPVEAMAATGFAVLLGKLFRVASADPNTALAILQAAGPVTVLWSLGVLVGPVVLPLVGMALLLRRERQRLLTGISNPVQLAGAGFTLAVGVVLTPLPGPWWALLAAALVIAGVVGASAWRLWRGTDRPRRAVRLLSGAIALCLVGAASAVLASDSIWVPSEFVTYNQSIGTRPLSRTGDSGVGLSNETHVVAYVLGSRDGWTTLLRRDPTTVLRVPDGAIVAREVCGPNPGRARSIVQRIFSDASTIGNHSCHRPFGQVFLGVTLPDDPDHLNRFGYSVDSPLQVATGTTLRLLVAVDNSGDRLMTGVRAGVGLAFEGAGV